MSLCNANAPLRCFVKTEQTSKVPSCQAKSFSNPLTSNLLIIRTTYAIRKNFFLIVLHGWISTPSPWGVPRPPNFTPPKFSTNFVQISTSLSYALIVMKMFLQFLPIDRSISQLTTYSKCNSYKPDIQFSLSKTYKKHTKSHGFLLQNSQSRETSERARGSKRKMPSRRREKLDKKSLFIPYPCSPSRSRRKHFVYEHFECGGPATHR